MTAASPSRKTPPDIPAEGGDDAPPGEATQKGPAAQVIATQLTPGEQHKRDLENKKFRLACWLIACCLTTLAILSGVDHWFTPTSSHAPTLTPVYEVLKLVATTSLGYALSRVDAKDQ